MPISELLAKKRLNQRAAADYLNISSQVWHRMKKAGELPEPFRLGSMEYWFPEQLDAWVLENNPHLADEIETAAVEPAKDSEFKGVANA